MDDERALVSVDPSELTRLLGQRVSQPTLGPKEWCELASSYFRGQFPIWRNLLLWQHPEKRPKKGVTRLLLNNVLKAIRMTEAELRTSRPPYSIDAGSLLQTAQLYSALIHLMNVVDNSPGMAHEIKLCAMHGTLDKLQVPVDADKRVPGLADFGREIAKRIKDPTWSVDVIYNICGRDPERWQQIKQRMELCPRATDHEIKYYDLSGTAQVICPCLIGGAYAFMAVSHENFYAADYGLMLNGQDGYRFAEECWKNLWDRAKPLRGSASAIPEAVAELDLHFGQMT